MENKYIKSLEKLKEFNKTYEGISGLPDYRQPILLEWFLDWFFDEALKDKKLAVEAVKELITFTKICEGMDDIRAYHRSIANLNYWYTRASKERTYRSFTKVKEVLKVEYENLRY